MAGEGYVQVTFTIDSEEAARALAKVVVENRKAACAQVGGPIRSVFWWEGKIDDSEEWVVTTKTAAPLADELVALIKEHHSYDTPEILVTPIISGFAPYLDWIDEETGQRA
jgi:periplasmic divalent cation tolerance protein